MTASAAVIIINTLRVRRVGANYRLLRLHALCGGRMILDRGSCASSAAQYLGRGNIKHFYGRHYSTVHKHDMRARVFSDRTGRMGGVRKQKREPRTHHLLQISNAYAIRINIFKSNTQWVR